MKFTCVYKSGTEYGTGERAWNYIAHVTSEGDKVAVRFSFVVPPKGKSQSGVTDASIKSLTLDLDKDEAFKLAASIIAQAHHPILHDFSASWMDPLFMQSLPTNQWSRKIRVLVDNYKNVITVNNKTKFHIGEIEFEIGYYAKDDESNSTNHTTSVLLLVDLPPGRSRKINIDEDDIPSRHQNSFRIQSAVAKAVTGVVLGQA
ncbi:hypothetical protein CA13_01920 [Planctomycetes bacterium CA13]|uniref:Uncharacterized protein n=1 Tax=Novipirellula herctigrandis TaxID=2527986 RepID=A0A5C5YUZ4_9BACT|nr:hypothetical protein CA13_01920 [Planctomycetes bacterium CA13]